MIIKTKIAFIVALLLLSGTAAAEGDAAAVRWEGTGGAHTQVLVDAATRRVTVLAQADWTGPEIVYLRALDDADRLVTEAMVGVQIVAVAPSLALVDLLEIPALVGAGYRVIAPDQRGYG